MSLINKYKINESKSFDYVLMYIVQFENFEIWDFLVSFLFVLE